MRQNDKSFIVIDTIYSKGGKGMSGITKAKINLKDGTIELEGSESFVNKQLEVFEQQIKEIGKSTSTNTNNNTGTTTNVADKNKTDGDKTPSKKKTGKSSQALIPIPLDLKAKDNKPALREFYKAKKPASQAESVVVFAYYLKEVLKIDKMEAGHVASCCKEVGIKVPTSISQMFYDIQHREGWLNLEEGRRLAVINTAGENFVIHDLPRKESVKSD